jgi:hypothetical protein
MLPRVRAWCGFAIARGCERVGGTSACATGNAARRRSLPHASCCGCGAVSRNYSPGYTYAPGYGDYAYAPGPGYSVGYSGGGDATYCSQRFRSYDPGSGTYLGYDGMRHPCP